MNEEVVKLFNRAVDAVWEEHKYAREKWNETTTPSGGFHSTGEFLIYIDTYLQAAKNDLTHNADPLGNQMALESVRKIANLAITAMVQNGIVERTP